MADKSLFPKGFTPYDGDSTVLVAFSGGADSRALFDLTAKFCRERGSFFYAAHVNHGIRGDEAIKDRDFCIEVAKSCPECREIFVLDANVPQMAAESGRSLETEARLLRYSFFNNIMKEKGITVLATAHNSDDNLETLIFNLTRGSGAKGMCGIPRVRKCEGGMVVRPILDMTKREILEYCKENSLDFVTDSTNQSTDYSRNLIRAKVIPLLEEINPDVRGAATRLSASMRKLCSFADEEANRLETDNASSLASMPDAIFNVAVNRLVKRADPDASLEAVHVASLRRLCEKGKDGSSLSLPSRLRARIDGDTIVIEADTGRTKSSPESFETNVSEGENLLPAGDILILSRSADITDLPFIKLEGADGLTVRSRKEGDKILSGGMHKSVKKLMCDKKIPISQRNTLPVICDGEGILWIPGIAISDRAKNKKGNIILSYKGN